MESYDLFPINLLESQGKIERESFLFIADNYKIWQDGRCIKGGNVKVIISADIRQNMINVELDNPIFSDYMLNSMNFSEISLNRDRILWSNNLMGDFMSGGLKTPHKEPAFMSLFYVSGKLSKVAFSINNPKVMIELTSGHAN
jgi:hypothetical protein